MCPVFIKMESYDRSVEKFKEEGMKTIPTAFEDAFSVLEAMMDKHSVSFLMIIVAKSNDPCHQESSSLFSITRGAAC